MALQWEEVTSAFIIPRMRLPFSDWGTHPCSGKCRRFIVGLLLSWAADPGWTVLVLMWPNGVGGTAGGVAADHRWNGGRETLYSGGRDKSGGV